MHPAQILAALILLAPAAQTAAGTFEQFEQKIGELEKKVTAEKSVVKRYDLFLATHSELAKLKKDSKREDETDELAMSQFLDTLADLPAKAKFEAKKCADYEKKAKTMMLNRKGEEEPAMVLRAVKLLGMICK